MNVIAIGGTEEWRRKGRDGIGYDGKGTSEEKLEPTARLKIIEWNRDNLQKLDKLGLDALDGLWLAWLGWCCCFRMEVWRKSSQLQTIEKLPCDEKEV